MGDTMDALGGGMIALIVLGIVLLVIVVLIQTNVITGTDENPLDASAWYWWLLDAIAIIMIVVGAGVLCSCCNCPGNISYSNITFPSKEKLTKALNEL